LPQPILVSDPGNSRDLALIIAEMVYPRTRAWAATRRSLLPIGPASPFEPCAKSAVADVG